MTGRPTPETRYEDLRLQAAYEAGFWQEHKHDVYALLDRFETVDGAWTAAVLLGTSDALAELAEQAMGTARESTPA
jgi:hypothetical protein